MPSSTLNIEFDLDGVLVNYLGCLEKYLKNRGVESIPNGTFYFDTSPEMTNKVFYKYINAALRCVDDIHPWKGAVDVIRLLWERTHDPIRIITNRPKDTIDVTQTVIEKVLGDIPYFLAMVEDGNKKYQWIRSKCFIDDRRRNAITLAQHGYTVFMPEREYNWPIKVQEGFAICYKGLWEHAGIWSRNDGRIIVIDDIQCLMHPEWLELIVS